MQIQPFYCDITSGNSEEQNEFKKLYKDYSKELSWTFTYKYYGFSRYGNPVATSSELFIKDISCKIISLSEGISILRKLVATKILRQWFSGSMLADMQEYPIQLPFNRGASLLIPKDTTVDDLKIIKEFIDAIKPN